MRKKRVAVGYQTILSRLEWKVRNANWIEKDNIVMKKKNDKGVVTWGIFKDKELLFSAKEASVS